MFSHYYSVRCGQIKNIESARVSMIGQVKPCSKSHKSDNMTAAGKSTIFNSDSITEEGEDESQSSDYQQVSMCRVKTSA